MHKKLTITIDEEIYRGLYRIIGTRKISQFIENLVKPHVIGQNLAAAYEEMARDETRELAAHDWTEGVIGDINHAER